jgi:uncharacterized protein YkwD
MAWPALATAGGAKSAHSASAASHGRTARERHSAVCGSPASRRRKTAARKASCHGATRRAATFKPRRRTSGVTKATELAATQAAVIAQVLATPCQNTELTPEPSNLTLVRAAVLCLVNTERAHHGEEPLQSNPSLEHAAASHGREMISVDYFDHVSPSGITPVDRVREEGYIPSSEVGYVIGENLAWGTLSLATPEAIVAAWIASPEHLANMLEAKYRETGIDVEPQVPAALAEEGEQGALYTQEFGVIVH